MFFRKKKKMNIESMMKTIEDYFDDINWERNDSGFILIDQNKKNPRFPIALYFFEDNIMITIGIYQPMIYRSESIHEIISMMEQILNDEMIVAMHYMNEEAFLNRDMLFADSILINDEKFDEFFDGIFNTKKFDLSYELGYKNIIEVVSYSKSIYHKIVREYKE